MLALWCSLHEHENASPRHTAIYTSIIRYPVLTIKKVFRFYLQLCNRALKMRSNPLIFSSLVRLQMLGFICNHLQPSATGCRCFVVCHPILGTRRPLSQCMGCRWAVICHPICNRISGFTSMSYGDISGLVADGRWKWKLFSCSGDNVEWGQLRLDWLLTKASLVGH